MKKQDEGAVGALLPIVRAVRRRWRLKLLLRGAAIVGAAALLLVVASSWALQRAGFAPAALLVSRVVAYGTLAWLLFRYVVRPLARRVTDEQVALYLEEHDPDAHELLLTGLHVERQGVLSPLAGRIVRAALEVCARLQDGRLLERRDMRRSGAALLGVTGAALLLTGLQPAALRSGVGALLHPWRRAAAVSAYAIEVEPGDVTIPRGAEQRIRARLHGFQAGDVVLVARSGSDSAFQRLPMSADSGGRYEVSLFDVREATEYFVESGGVRSAVYHIRVADLPYVKALALEYRYPAYTGLAPERVEVGGDVAAVRGTRVHVEATTTVPAAGGEIVLSNGARFPLARDSAGAWTGEFPIEHQGFYHIELKAPGGQAVNGSPEYAIDVLPDRPPSVRLTAPGRDTRPTSVDEVYVEARADDDYGVRALELHYSVNGGPEKSLDLFQSAHGPTGVTAGHTLYLEEMALQPGDIVSYYARARDNGPGSRPATSDIYFLTVRPFGRDYRQADSGGPPGGGGQGENAGELTRQQREIVAATFNLARDSAGYTAGA